MIALALQEHWASSRMCQFSCKFVALLQSFIGSRTMGCCIHSDAIPFDVELTLEEFELLLELHLWFASQDFDTAQL